MICSELGTIILGGSGRVWTFGILRGKVHLMDHLSFPEASSRMKLEMRLILSTNDSALFRVCISPPYTLLYPKRAFAGLGSKSRKAALECKCIATS